MPGGAATSGLVLLAGLLSGCGGSLDSSLAGGVATETKVGLEQSVPDKAPTTAKIGESARVAAATATTPAATASTVSTAKVGDKQLAKTAEAMLAVSTPGSSGYKIGPQDVLDITVFKVAELTRSVQVSETGTINFPLIGEMPAAGKTAMQLERELAAKLGVKYLQSPQVTVYTKEFNSQRVTIEGAVKKPGVYPLRGRTTLLQLIAITEGQTEVAESEVVVFRQIDGKRLGSRFDVGEIRAGRIEDPVMVAGDVVVANESGVKSAFQNTMKALPIANFARIFY